MAGFYVWSTVGVIARFEATVAFLAEALAAFGDTEVDEIRRVKAFALLANPTAAVELLAAFAALRSQHATPRRPQARSEAPDSDLDSGPVTEPFQWPAEAPLKEPDLDDESESNPFPFDDPDDGAGRSPDTDPALDLDVDEEAGSDPLQRINACARRVGFTPTGLPAWLDPRHAAHATHSGPDPSGPPQQPAQRQPQQPTFMFDWSRLLPSLTLHLHLSAGDLTGGSGGVVRWEGEGPVTHQFVHDHLRPLHRYRIQPVLDPTAMAPVDAYEIPDRLRQAVHLRTPADTFPYSSNTSRRVDVDHTENYDPTNATRPEKHWSTRMGNLGPLGRFGHRIKTHGRWTLRQPFDGIYLWRDPHGQIYLVDHTGTHQVTTPGHSAGPATRRDPDISIHPTDTVIEIDFT